MHGRSAEGGAGEGEDCVCYSISAKAPKISYIVENVVNELSAPIKRSQVAGSQVAGSCQQVTGTHLDRQTEQVSLAGRGAGGQAAVTLGFVPTLRPLFARCATL